jgi:hypothetical protein
MYSISVNARIPVPPVQLSAPPDSRLRTAFVWETQFGRVVIEVEGDQVFVNGDKVEPAGTNEACATHGAGQ